MLSHVVRHATIADIFEIFLALRDATTIHTQAMFFRGRRCRRPAGRRRSLSQGLARRWPRPWIGQQRHSQPPAKSMELLPFKFNRFMLYNASSRCFILGWIHDRGHKAHDDVSCSRANILGCGHLVRGDRKEVLSRGCSYVSCLSCSPIMLTSSDRRRWPCP